MSMSARASATVRLTTRQSSSTRCGPPTPVSTSTAPPGWVTTKPCTGHTSSVPGPCRDARCSRLISRDISDNHLEPGTCVTRGHHDLGIMIAGPATSVYREKERDEQRRDTRRGGTHQPRPAAVRWRGGGQAGSGRLSRRDSRQDHPGPARPATVGGASAAGPGPVYAEECAS